MTEKRVKPLLTVSNVAEWLGLCEERVRQLTRSGEIKATKIGGWCYEEHDVVAFIQSRQNRKP